MKDTNYIMQAICRQIKRCIRSRETFHSWCPKLLNGRVHTNYSKVYINIHIIIKNVIRNISEHFNEASGFKASCTETIRYNSMTKVVLKVYGAELMIEFLLTLCASQTQNMELIMNTISHYFFILSRKRRLTRKSFICNHIANVTFVLSVSLCCLDSVNNTLLINGVWCAV